MANNPNAEIFKYCPKCGSKKLKANDSKSFNCSECNFIFFINTAAATAGLIFDKLGRLLVTVRKIDPLKGTYDLPGGFSDPSEKIEETLIREVKEELNLDIFNLKYFSSEPNDYHYKDVNYTTLDMIFLCQTNSFDKIMAKDDVEDFIFLEQKDLDENKFGLTSIKNLISKIKNNYPVKS